MAKPKKKEKALVDTEDTSMLEHLSSAYKDHVKECAESDIEAFEAYAHRLQSHIHDHLKDFSERVDKGYLSLLNVLETK